MRDGKYVTPTQFDRVVSASYVLISQFFRIPLVVISSLFCYFGNFSVCCHGVQVGLGNCAKDVWVDHIGFAEGAWRKAWDSTVEHVEGFGKVVVEDMQKASVFEPFCGLRCTGCIKVQCLQRTVVLVRCCSTLFTVLPCRQFRTFRAIAARAALLAWLNDRPLIWSVCG